MSPHSIGSSEVSLRRIKKDSLNYTVRVKLDVLKLCFAINSSHSQPARNMVRSM